MLAAEVVVQAVLELPEGGVLVAWDGDGGGLVAGGVCLYEVLEGVVVDVIWRAGRTRAPGQQEDDRPRGRDSGGGGGQNSRRLHSGTDSCSSWSPYFMASPDQAGLFLRSALGRVFVVEALFRDGKVWGELWVWEVVSVFPDRRRLRPQQQAPLPTFGIGSVNDASG